MRDTIYINSIKIYPFLNSSQLISYIFEKKGILVAVNAEKILHATSQTRNIINNNIGYPDGIGAVWALKKAGVKGASRIPGVELWLEIINSFYKEKSFYLVGGSQDVIEKTVKKLWQEFKGIKIIGYRNGYINSENERDELFNQISEKKPDIVFVAMGSPRQELLIQEMFKFHPAIYQGLGGSFDVYIGKVKRAPVFWQRLNLEWFYRWYKQPLSRTKRNLQLFKFVYKLYLGKL